MFHGIIDVLVIKIVCQLHEQVFNLFIYLFIFIIILLKVVCFLVLWISVVWKKISWLC